MSRVLIVVEVEPEHADDDDATGLTNMAYELLTDPSGLPLGWLGEIQDVRRDNS